VAEINQARGQRKSDDDGTEGIRMKRFGLFATGILITIAMAGAPTAALAGSSGAAGETAVHAARAGGQAAADAKITLGSQQCDAMRRSLHEASASCAVELRIRVRAVGASGREESGRRPAAAAATSSTYYVMDDEWCGDATCSSWWVYQSFEFTVSDTQAWENSNPGPSCIAHDTGISWCGYAGNGDSGANGDYLNFGFNYSTSAWARLNIEPLDGYVDGQWEFGVFATGSNTGAYQGTYCFYTDQDCPLWLASGTPV
jgi:hypothetical protein